MSLQYYRPAFWGWYYPHRPREECVDISGTGTPFTHPADFASTFEGRVWRTTAHRGACGIKGLSRPQGH